MKKRIVVVIAVAGLAVVGIQSATPASGQEAASRMRDLFGALSALLPYSLQTDTWNSPTNAPRIEEGLAHLAAHASAIQHHGLGLNRSYGRARDALAADAREALVSYRTGDAQIARYIVRNITEDCLACHSRLPAYSATEVGEELTAAVDLDRLDPAERLRLLVATRQFDAALQAAEAMIADDTLRAVDIDLMGVFELYLKVAVRVSRDYERPRTTLWTFLQRDDVPLYLADLVGDWIAALEEFGRGRMQPDLRLATDLLREASNRNEYVRDRRGMVHAIVASSLLHQLVQSAPEDDLVLAEAYYRLGIAETSISRTIWVPETEYFLETAIRVAPQSSHARNAYTFLEQYVLASYTGSAGTNLPDDVWDRLAELRALVEGEGE